MTSRPVSELSFGYSKAFSDDHVEERHRRGRPPLLGGESLKVGDKEDLLAYFGVNYYTVDELTHNIDIAINTINDLDRRITRAENSATVLTIQEARRKLNPLSYIRPRSVKFVQTPDGKPFLKFTVVDTYVSPSEDWNEVHSSYKYVVPFEDKPYILLSPINVAINLYDKHMTLKPGKSENKVRFRNSRVHPHYSGGACLGNMDSTLHEAIASLDVRFIAATVRTWLQTATTNDAWGNTLNSGFMYIADQIIENSDSEFRGLPMSRPMLEERGHCPPAHIVHLAGQRRVIRLNEVAKGVYELYIDDVLIGRYDPHAL